MIYLALQPTIDKYLIADCLFIIDEFNVVYEKYTLEELKKEADESFNEMDITVRLGYPFKQNAHYTSGDKKQGENKKVNHDLYIINHDFKIEIKYLKNWNSASDTRTSSKTWKEFQKDFDWLMNEIDAGNNGKVAFVIGWFNCVKSFSQLMQIGTGRGAYPMVDERKLAYFPFLARECEPAKTRDLIYQYSGAYKEYTLNQIGTRTGDYHCIFLGRATDRFHFAIYY